MKLLLFALVCLPIALAGPIEIEDRSFFGLDAHALAHCMLLYLSRDMTKPTK